MLRSDAQDMDLELRRDCLRTVRPTPSMPAVTSWMGHDRRDARAGQTAAEEKKRDERATTDIGTLDLSF